MDRAQAVISKWVKLEGVSVASKKAKKYIAKKMKTLSKEGYKGKQKAAIAYSYAKKKGYKVGKRKG
jgi:hypothetical protein